MYYPDDSVFVTGVAKVGKEDAINAMYGNFSLSLVIDIHTNRIISLSCNMVMSATVEFIRSFTLGKNILTQADEIEDNVKKRFLALSQKALLVAFKDAQNRYLMAYPENRK